MQWLWQIDWAIIFKIIIVDILLGGDNALIIALACRNLPSQKRFQGVLWGTVGAIVIRVILIFFFLSLLEYPAIKLIGGLLLLWIGVKLILPQAHNEEQVAGATSLWGVVQTIVIADLVMSLDNIVAITGAAQSTHAEHQMLYVIFGLIVSIPIIIWGSTLILRLIDRFPIIITLGAAFLGWLGGGMIVSDRLLMPHLAHLPYHHLIAEIIGAIVVLVLGFMIKQRQGDRSTSA